RTCPRDPRQPIEDDAFELWESTRGQSDTLSAGHLAELDATVHRRPRRSPLARIPSCWVRASRVSEEVSACDCHAEGRTGSNGTRLSRAKEDYEPWLKAADSRDAQFRQRVRRYRRARARRGVGEGAARQPKSRDRSRQ